MSPTQEELDQMDAEANYFAMCLLMPEDALRKELAKMGRFDMFDDKAIKKLSDKFRVPTAALLIRLGQIGVMK